VPVRNLARGAAIALAALAAACADRAEPDPGPTLDSATLSAIRAESVTAAAVAARPPSALWDADRVSERLVRAGVGPRRIDSVPPAPSFFRDARVAAFAVVGGGQLRVFIFPDSARRRAATDGLDPVTVAPPGAESPWPSEPLLILSNNLAAVMLGSRPVYRERVQLALEAGLPSK
jgi:hypothetical protein